MAPFPSQLQVAALLRLLSPSTTLPTINPCFQRAVKGAEGLFLDEAVSSRAAAL